MKNSIGLILACLAGAVGVGACGSTSTSTDTTSSTGSTSSSGGASGVVNGCDPSTTAVSAGDVTITFPTGVAPAQYSPACVTVHEGATVTWSGAFADHPLTPDGSGPITATSTGTTAAFTFPAAGSFGFHCSLHPTVMLGAVFVVP